MKATASHSRASAAFRAAVVAFVCTTPVSPCVAADSMSSLASAFRPQGVVDRPPEGARAQRPDASPTGLRVLVSRSSHPVASIDGQIVHVGDTVHGMRVTRIDAQGVVLQGEDGASESLGVTPSVVKRSRLPEATHNSKGNRP